MAKKKLRRPVTKVPIFGIFADSIRTTEISVDLNMEPKSAMIRAMLADVARKQKRPRKFVIKSEIIPQYAFQAYVVGWKVTVPIGGVSTISFSLRLCDAWTPPRGGKNHSRRKVKP
jgi:hypothetical protein